MGDGEEGTVSGGSIGLDSKRPLVDQITDVEDAFRSAAMQLDPSSSTIVARP
jgi:hypothetical protein